MKKSKKFLALALSFVVSSTAMANNQEASSKVNVDKKGNVVFFPKSDNDLKEQNQNFLAQPVGEYSTFLNSVKEKQDKIVEKREGQSVSYELKDFPASNLKIDNLNTQFHLAYDESGKPLVLGNLQNDYTYLNGKSNQYASLSYLSLPFEFAIPLKTGIEDVEKGKVRNFAFFGDLLCPFCFAQEMDLLTQTKFSANYYFFPVNTKAHSKEVNSWFWCVDESLRSKNFKDWFVYKGLGKGKDKEVYEAFKDYRQQFEEKHGKVQACNAPMEVNGYLLSSISGEEGSVSVPTIIFSNWIKEKQRISIENLDLAFKKSVDERRTGVSPQRHPDWENTYHNYYPASILKTLVVSYLEDNAEYLKQQK